MPENEIFLHKCIIFLAKFKNINEGSSVLNRNWFWNRPFPKIWNVSLKVTSAKLFSLETDIEFATYFSNNWHISRRKKRLRMITIRIWNFVNNCSTEEYFKSNDRIFLNHLKWFSTQKMSQNVSTKKQIYRCDQILGMTRNKKILGIFFERVLLGKLY